MTKRLRQIAILVASLPRMIWLFWPMCHPDVWPVMREPAGLLLMQLRALRERAGKGKEGA